jgi:ribosomal protein S17E
MKRYCIKCRPERVEYFDVVREFEDRYLVRLTRIYDGNEKVCEETMTKHLFNICLKTGYIYELASEIAAVA